MVVSKDNGTLRQRALSRLQVRLFPSRRLAPCSLRRSRFRPGKRAGGRSPLFVVTACVSDGVTCGS